MATVVKLFMLNHASVNHDNNKKEINMSITNSEKFRTAEERTVEFNKFCKGNRNCIKCKIYKAKKRPIYIKL